MRTLGTWATSAAAVSLVLLASAASAQDFAIHTTFDIPGHDFRSIPSRSLRDCEKECTNEGQCLGFARGRGVIDNEQVVWAGDDLSNLFNKDQPSAPRQATTGSAPANPRGREVPPTTLDDPSHPNQPIATPTAVGDAPSKSASQGKVISDFARKLAGSFAEKSALAVGRALAEALGVLEPNDADARFNALHDQLLTLASGRSWEHAKNFIDEQRGPAIRAIRNLKRNGTTLPGSIDDQDSGNAAETMRLGGAAFYRSFDPQMTQGRWTAAIKYDRSELDPRPGDLVYDWRLGIPALLEVISYRLQVIAAINPNFRNDDSYDEELEGYRSALQQHYDKMLTGIKCARNQPKTTCSWWFFGCRTPLPEYDIACADIRTGIEAIEEYPLVGQTGQPFDVVTGRLSGTIRRSMPLFEVKAMIDTLDYYQSSRSDLTALRHQIPSVPYQGLCLDVQFGNPQAGTPIWLFPCNGTDAQRWVYDRRSATIRNTIFEKCLDVQGESITPGTPLQTWDCHGGDSQRWTYNHRAQVLESGLGTVLEIRRVRKRSRWWNPFGARASVGAKTPVWTASRNGSEIQQWVAEQPSNCAHSVCQAGAALTRQCDSCVSRVCEEDFYCCEVSWDRVCLQKAMSACGADC